MNTPDFAKLLADSWPSFVGALIGSTIGHILLRRSPDIGRLRRQLGHSLDRFADVPPKRLDPALLAAAQAAQSGWGSIVSILVTAFWLGAALFSGELYRALFPEPPRWHSIVICAVVAGFLAWAMQGIERRGVLHRLKHLHNEPGSA